MITRISTKLLVFSTTLLLCFAQFAFSATLQLTKIGNLDLGGKTYSEWWYTNASPTLLGKAAPSSDVTIAVGSDTFKVKSDDGGVWTYVSTLALGDYDIVISQGQEKISFKLHLGQNLPENFNATGTQSSQSTIPSTGSNQLVALGMGFGVLLLATYFYITGDPRRKSVFEAKILKED